MSPFFRGRPTQVEPSIPFEEFDVNSAYDRLGLLRPYLKDIDSKTPHPSARESASLLEPFLKLRLPWENSQRLQLIRYDYVDEGERIDPGCNFFVLFLETIGARPRFSCEGHPDRFHVAFSSSVALADRIKKLGIFSLNDESAYGFDIYLSPEVSLFKRDHLETAARLWIEDFFPNLAAK